MSATTKPSNSSLASTAMRIFKRSNGPRDSATDMVAHPSASGRRASAVVKQDDMVVSLFLDQPEYALGDIVSGHISISVPDQAITVRSLRIELRATVKTWSLTDPLAEQLSRPLHSELAVLIGATDTATLSGSAAKKVSAHLSLDGEYLEGEGAIHEYPFAFHIPTGTTCPASLNARAGWIRWKLKGAVDRPLHSMAGFNAPVVVRPSPRAPPPELCDQYERTSDRTVSKGLVLGIWRFGAVREVRLRAQCDKAVYSAAENAPMRIKVYLQALSGRKLHMNRVQATLTKKEFYFRGGGRVHQETTACVVCKCEIPKAPRSTAELKRAQSQHNTNNNNSSNNTPADSALAPVPGEEDPPCIVPAADRTIPVYVDRRTLELELILTPPPNLVPSVVNVDQIRVEYALRISASGGWGPIRLHGLDVTVPILVY
ncbi:hypothetical protein BC828DRAFT_373919 [Blastocladiella britannica]|nr:hypothetical protein BC828DRAFT_373919 [Blastocladiella britannica]